MTISHHVHDAGLVSILETTATAHEQAMVLADLVAQAAAYGNGPLPPELQAELSKQHKILNTNLTHLRGQNRAAQFAARDTKSQTAEARSEVDRLHLQLSNLYYEQQHLEGEIASCESYDHKYTRLPMIPKEDFLALHPELANSDENDIMIARISHEKAEREALELKRLELVKRKQKLTAENKKRSDDLANLDKNLEKFIDGGQPIQKLLEKVV